MCKLCGCRAITPVDSLALGEDQECCVRALLASTGLGLLLEVRIGMDVGAERCGYQRLCNQRCGQRAGAQGRGGWVDG